MKTTQRFNEIYADFYEDVYSYICSRIQHERSYVETAEDLTQDVFLKIAENCEYFNPKKATLKTWVFNYVNNTVTDHQRTDKSSKTTLVDGYVSEDGKETFEHTSTYAQHGIEEKEIYRAIRRMMRTLTPQEQKIANLHFLQDLKYKEVCDALDISMGTVKGLINRIKGKLQSKLMPLYQEM